MALDAEQLRSKAKHLSDTFGPAQLTVIGLLGVLTVLGGLWFMRWASTPTMSVLFAGMTPSDTASVTQELDAQGVPYELGGNGTTILVPQERVHDVRLSMSAQGLPSGGTVGFEIFDKQGLTTSEFRQRVDYQRALEGELSRTLMSMQGVGSATVHLSIPPETLFSDDEEPTRASVLLRSNGAIGDEAVSSIVHLVASSVPGLQPDGVTVADVNGRVLSNGGDAGSLTNRQLKLTRQYEQQLAADAALMLAQVMGPNRAVVRVSADLNFDESERESETYDPTNAAAIREQTETETFTGPANDAAGALGVDGLPVDTGSGSDTSYERNASSREVGIDRVVERSRVAPGRVTRLSVAVVLDAAADPSPAPATVESIVSAALGIDPTRGDSIVVDSLEFDTALAEAADAASASAASAASTDQLMGYARTGVGALVLLLVMFFLVRGTRRVEEEIDLGDGALAAALAEAQTPNAALATAARGLPAGVGATGGSSYDNQVLGLIDQQPDEVAMLLRGWLADRRG